MLEIKLCTYAELPPECQEDAYEGDGYQRYLVVKHNGIVVAFHSDSIEPEDATFYRDLSWVPRLLKKVYDFGQEDALME